MTTVKKVSENYLKKVPELRPGDTVRVHQKIKEGGKERIQVFEGVVLKVKSGGIEASFLVRKISFGIGVEKNFPLHSPNIAKIEVKKRAKVRQAYLTYLRDLRGKSARLRDKQFDSLAVNVQSSDQTNETQDNADKDKGKDAVNKDKVSDADVTELDAEEISEPKGEISLDEVADKEEKKARKEDKEGASDLDANHQTEGIAEVEEGIKEAEADLEVAKAAEGKTAEKSKEDIPAGEVVQEIAEEKD